MTFEEEISLWKNETAFNFAEVIARINQLVAEPPSNELVADCRGSLSKLDLCVFQGFSLLHKQFEATYTRPEPPKPRVTLDDLFSEL